MRSRTYLDYNATAPLRPEARDAMVAAFDVFGNPSSVHADGRRARALVEAARESVAKLVAADPAGVVFTSGATEANAQVLSAGWDMLFVGPTEHELVEAAACSSGATLVRLPIDRYGVVDLEAAEDLVARARGRALLSLQLANNETGVVQDVARLSAVARSHGVRVHCDAVQGVGRIPVDMRHLEVDALTLTAHKFGGPKGVGALVLADGFAVPPRISGGGQERRRRAGTENVAGITGMGAAADAARRDLGDMARIAALRDQIDHGIASRTPECHIISAEAPRLPNTTCVAAQGTSAELVVIKLDLAGVSVSAGAACSSGKVGPSRILTAMGVGEDIARSAIRVSLGWQSSAADVSTFLSAWESAVAMVPARRAVA